jgi:GNAT superfamily N-acetyltransferase
MNGMSLSGTRRRSWPNCEVPHGDQRAAADVGLELRRCPPAQVPASELIDAVLDEYDATAGQVLSGGPRATAADFSPPGGAFLVGFIGGVAVCGGGIKTLSDGAAEIKRMYVVPQHRRRGVGRALLHALEDTARELGHEVVRLDSTAATWPLYLAAGYRQVANYNDNPHAACWGEKRL